MLEMMKRRKGPEKLLIAFFQIFLKIQREYLLK